jgi:hypothetical protein
MVKLKQPHQQAILVLFTDFIGKDVEELHSLLTKEQLIYDFLIEALQVH